MSVLAMQHHEGTGSAIPAYLQNGKIVSIAELQARSPDNASSWKDFALLLTEHATIHMKGPNAERHV
jgi:hypothetical protein